jgi:hypothetical protein
VTLPNVGDYVEPSSLIPPGNALVNYYFVPAAKSGKVSYCVLPCDSYGDAYVASISLGAANITRCTTNSSRSWRSCTSIAAEERQPNTHLVKDGSSTRPSYLNRISKAAGMKVSNWSVSHIDRSTNPPKVLSKFIHLEHLPILDSFWSRRQWRRVDRGGDRPCAAHRKAPARGRRGLR